MNAKKSTHILVCSLSLQEAIKISDNSKIKDIMIKFPAPAMRKNDRLQAYFRLIDDKICLCVDNITSDTTYFCDYIDFKNNGGMIYYEPSISERISTTDILDWDDEEDFDDFLEEIDDTPIDPGDYLIEASFEALFPSSIKETEAIELMIEEELHEKTKNVISWHVK